MDYVIFRDIAVVLIAGKYMGLLARRWKAPQVAGEILAGLLIGPCLLGLVRKRKIEEDTSGKSKAAIFHKWQPLSAYRLGRFLPWEASFRGIAVRESFQ